MRKVLFILAIAALVLSGCGRKEPPQPVTSNAPPAIVEISHIVEGNILRISMELSGGSDGIGFQVDQAEIDPYCNCPGFWRRYREKSPHPQNFDKPLSQLITLKSLEKEYAFRVRAIDALGRLSEWSKVIRVRAETGVFQ
jgi:hypothetical protein